MARPKSPGPALLRAKSPSTMGTNPPSKPNAPDFQQPAREAALGRAPLDAVAHAELIGPEPDAKGTVSAGVVPLAGSASPVIPRRTSFSVVPANLGRLP